MPRQRLSDGSKTSAMTSCALRLPISRDIAYAAPEAVGRLEDLGDDLLRPQIAFPCHDPVILYFDGAPAFLELFDEHIDAHERVYGLEPCYHSGRLVIDYQEAVCV